MLVFIFILQSSAQLFQLDQNYSTNKINYLTIHLASFGFQLQNQIYLKIQLQSNSGSYPYLAYCPKVPDAQIRQILSSEQSILNHMESQNQCVFDNIAATFNQKHQALQLMNQLTQENVYNMFSIYKLSDQSVSFYIYSDNQAEYQITIEASFVGSCIQDCNNNGVCSSDNAQYACVCSLGYIDSQCSLPTPAVSVPTQDFKLLILSHQQLILSVALEPDSNEGLTISYTSDLDISVGTACYLEQSSIPSIHSKLQPLFVVNGSISIDKKIVINCKKVANRISQTLNQTVTPRIILILYNNSPIAGALELSVSGTDNSEESDNLIYYIIAIIFGGLILVIFIMACVIYHKFPHQQDNRQAQPIVNNELKAITVEEHMPKQYYHTVIEVYPGLRDINDCQICLVDFLKDDIVRLTLCLHIFHRECLDQWMQRNETCPFCRESLSQYALIKNGLHIKQAGAIGGDYEFIDQHQTELQHIHMLRMLRLKNHIEEIAPEIQQPESRTTKVRMQSNGT